jgi:hypothetical protein
MDEMLYDRDAREAEYHLRSWVKRLNRAKDRGTVVRDERFALGCLDLAQSLGYRVQGQKISCAPFCPFLEDRAMCEQHH